MLFSRPLVLVSFLALLTQVGCLPKIGDDCITDVDCSQQGDRLCDTTQPGGYCTVADCDPRSCPEKESVCVSFNNVRSTVGVCEDAGQSSPYRRNFCMASCKSDKDCRSAYSCVDLSGDNPWGAGVIQRYPDSYKVCMVTSSHPDIDEEERSDGFCATGLGGSFAQ